MKSIWKKINKAIGVLNLAIGVVIFYIIFDLTQKQVNYIQSLTEENGFTKIEASFLALFLINWILLLIGILSVVSGIFIFLRKWLGWTLGYSYLLISISILTPITIFGIRDVTTTIIGPGYWVQIYGGIGILTSLCLLLLLSTKPIRILNRVNRNSWLLSFGIVFLIYVIARIL